MFGGFNLKCLSSDKELSHNPEIQMYAPLLISGFVGLEPVEQRYFPVNIKQHLSSGNVSSVIRNLVFDLKEKNIDGYKKMEERLYSDFGFRLSDAQFDGQKDMYISANYAEVLEKKDISFDFNSSGSGYMQIALAKSLQKIQKELDIQFIISTHSAAIIKTVSPNHVIPISTDNKTCLPLTNQTEVEESIAKIDNYEIAKSVISGKMVFIEDAKIDVWETVDKIERTNIFSGSSIVSIQTGRGKDDKLPFQIKNILGSPSECVENKHVK